uniref:Uncharacterized protein n=1 Tax=Rhizophagus irregularis (strain DAOM 181602 / DAOM 197198 / MUCL 43194) TaxID=747089 RepID=U9UCK2_RHIID
MSPFWDSIGTIDRDIRKFSKTITDTQTFDSFSTNTKLQETFSNHKTSIGPSLGFIITKLRTYATPIKCPICKAEDDTNSHLGFYFSVLLEINRIIKDSKANLYTKISLHAGQRQFMLQLLTKLYSAIWLKHTDAMKKWELAEGITTSKKKRYKKKRYQRTKNRTNQTVITTGVSRPRPSSSPNRTFTKHYDANHHFDDRLRINVKKRTIISGIILITSRYLHAE